MNKLVYRSIAGALAITSVLAWSSYFDNKSDADLTDRVEKAYAENSYLDVYKYDYLKELESINERTYGNDVLELLGKAEKDKLAVILNLNEDEGTLRFMGTSLGNVEGKTLTENEVFPNTLNNNISSQYKLSELSRFEVVSLHSQYLVTEFNAEELVESDYSPILNFGYLAEGNTFSNIGQLTTYAKLGEFIPFNSVEKINPDARYLVQPILGSEGTAIGMYVEEYGGSINNSPLAFQFYALDKLASLKDYTE